MNKLLKSVHICYSYRRNKSVGQFIFFGGTLCKLTAHTWYLLEELNGISQIFLFSWRYAVTLPIDSSTHFSNADSDASPLHSLSQRNTINITLTNDVQWHIHKNQQMAQCCSLTGRQSTLTPPTHYQTVNLSNYSSKATRVSGPKHYEQLDIITALCHQTVSWGYFDTLIVRTVTVAKLL